MARGVERGRRAARPGRRNDRAAGGGPTASRFAQVRVPIGVIAIIYESRPNVTVDAGVLGFKAGNAVVLRGGKEALATNALSGRTDRARARERRARSARGELHRQSRSRGDPDSEAPSRGDRSDHSARRQCVEGGARRIRGAAAAAFRRHLPHLRRSRRRSEDGRGNLLQRQVQPAVGVQCDGDDAGASRDRAAISAAHRPRGWSARASSCAADERRCAIVPEREAGHATRIGTPSILDLILAVKVVDSLDEAIAFIARHGSGLADAIVTRRSRERRALSTRSRFGDGLRQRVDPLHRRLRIRLRRRNRNLDQPPARARPDGPAGIDDLQIPRRGQRPGARIDAAADRSRT